MEIRASDSGSMVRLGERMVGIVKAVSTETDRVEIVRFDVIDRLFGSRFRSASAAAVAFDGLLSRGRPQATWTTYAAAWLTETGGRSIVPSSDTQARCKLRGEIIDWSRRNEPNPEFAAAQARVAGCRTNLLFRNSKTLIKYCEQSAREAMAKTSRALQLHTVQLKLELVPRAGAPVSKLNTVELRIDPKQTTSRADADLAVVQAAFGATAQELFGTGVCN